METQKFVGAVENAVKILRYLAGRGVPDGAASVARETDLNPSTTFNILKTLTKEGLVAFHPQDKTYSIGMGVLELSVPLLGRSPNDLIRPLLAELAEAHHALIAFWRINPNGRIVLSERFAPENLVHADMKLGARLPALAGAIGRCVAAQSTQSKLEIRKAFDDLRWQNPPSFDEYWADVETAKIDKFAFDFGNLFVGLNISAAIACDAEGQPRFGLSAISISGQADEAAMKAAAIALRDTAGRLEKDILGRLPRP